MGWRPGMPPIGYYNRSFAGVKDIVVDPDRGHIVTEMFERVAKNGDSGRTLKKWLDTCLTTRAGKKLTLSQIYRMLKSTFYYGEFEYPEKSGSWYKGKHPPLTTKSVFERVQEQLAAPIKSPWAGRKIAFKGLFKCGSCGRNIIGEVRWRKRKVGEPIKHIYYHCAPYMDRCPEPYISEEKLIRQILRYINFMNMAHPNEIHLKGKLEKSIQHFQTIREEVLYKQDINPNCIPLDTVEFAAYILRSGSIEEKRGLVLALDRQLYIKNQFISANSAPVEFVC